MNEIYSHYKEYEIRIEIKNTNNIYSLIFHSYNIHKTKQTNSKFKF